MSPVFGEYAIYDILCPLYALLAEITKDSIRHIASTANQHFAKIY